MLFIVGLPAIQVLQPQTERPGQVGLILMGIAALVVLILGLIPLSDSPVDIGSIIPFLSILAGLLGSLIVGWLTVQAGVFPGVDCLLIIAEISNFVGGLLGIDPLVTIIETIAVLAQSAAIAGCGCSFVRHQAE